MGADRAGDARAQTDQVSAPAAPAQRARFQAPGLLDDEAETRREEEGTKRKVTTKKEKEGPEGKEVGDDEEGSGL